MKYEYRVFNLDGHDPEYQEKIFNELGAQGYELVTIAGGKAYFRRVNAEAALQMAHDLVHKAELLEYSGT